MFRFDLPGRSRLRPGSALAILLAHSPHVAATPSSESGIAASSTAEIVGEVTDPQGLLVPGADVILTPRER